MSPTQLMEFASSNWFDLLALLLFVTVFRAYLTYTARRSLDTPCLAYAMHRFRKQWIRTALHRENRIADTNIVANLERNVSFFASTSLLVLAGLVTLLSSADTVMRVLADIPFSDASSRGEWELKVMVLVVMFIYAFFKFTWSLRQFGLVSVMIGGAPEIADNPPEDVTRRHVDSISQMASKAAGNFNTGLRTYYFSMAALAWFVNAWLFIVISLLVVFVLYRREFKSDTLAIMMDDLPED